MTKANQNAPAPYTIENHPETGIFTIAELAKYFPRGYAQALATIEEGLLTDFWNNEYYKLFAEYFSGISQPLLVPYNSEGGRIIRASGTILVPEKLQEKWRKDFGVELSKVKITYPGTNVVEFELVGSKKAPDFQTVLWRSCSHGTKRN